MSQTEDKYCVLPGQTPVRLASLSSQIVIVGEVPRTIPLEFEQEARGKGCFTEAQVEGLVKRLAPAAPATEPEIGAEPGAEQNPDIASATDLSALAAADKMVEDDATAKRLVKINQAVIEIMNLGDTKLFDKKGKPELMAVAERLGFEVTAKELDAAVAAAKG